jgi:hypothetical protein
MSIFELQESSGYWPTNLTIITAVYRSPVTGCHVRLCRSVREAAVLVGSSVRAPGVIDLNLGTQLPRPPVDLTGHGL